MSRRFIIEEPRSQGAAQRVQVRELPDAAAVAELEGLAEGLVASHPIEIHLGEARSVPAYVLADLAQWATTVPGRRARLGGLSGHQERLLRYLFGDASPAGSHPYPDTAHGAQR